MNLLTSLFAASIASICPPSAIVGAPSPEATQREDANYGHLATARSEFGISVPQRGKDPRWEPETMNYSNVQLFPVARADQRISLNVSNSGEENESYMYCETKIGGKIRRDWSVLLKRVPKTKASRLSSGTGTLAAFLKLNGFNVVPPRGGSVRANVETKLKERHGYALYMATAVVAQLLYSHYVLPNGIETKEDKTENDETYRPTMGEYPLTGFPYPITPSEKQEIEANPNRFKWMF